MFLVNARITEKIKRKAVNQEPMKERKNGRKVRERIKEKQEGWSEGRQEEMK